MFLIFLTSGTASALIMTSLYGDIDGYGIGVPVNGSYTGYYPTLSKNSPADVGTITDEWLIGDKAWSQTYNISNFLSISAVSLEVTTLGQGWHGLSALYFDGQLMGTLTDGDNSGASLATNWSRRDVFNLSSCISLLDGVSAIRIDTYGTNNDQWALDYSKLTISGLGRGEVPSNPVPEPATLILIGTGLLGLAGFRRKMKK